MKEFPAIPSHLYTKITGLTRSTGRHDFLVLDVEDAEQRQLILSNIDKEIPSSRYKDYYWYITVPPYEDNTLTLMCNKYSLLTSRYRTRSDIHHIPPQIFLTLLRHNVRLRKPKTKE